MEFWMSVQAQLAEVLSQIVEGYVEFIKLMVWKPISWKVSTENALFQATFNLLFIF